MERVAAVCKPPETQNRAISWINDGDYNWNAAGCAPESFKWWARLRVWRACRRRTWILGHSCN
jgi:hypothetical protein